MLDIAIELLELGLSVVPLQKGKKIPPFGCTWKEQQQNLPSEELLEARFKQYPNSDLGCITGKVSGIVVVDGDSADACAWVEKNFPHTWLTVSNNGRGRHYYFKYPAVGVVHNSGSILHDDVDIRGDGGLVVLPPSVHKSENKYQWNIAEGFSIEDLADLPEYPTKYIETKKEYTEKAGAEYAPGELKNIAEQCAWVRHCRADAEDLCYDEWVWMLSVVSRCVDGRKKAHFLSRLSSKYIYEQCDKKIDEILKNMGAVSCRTISRLFDGCFECKNLIKGKNFSPVILGAEDALDEQIERITIEDIKKEKINNLTLSLTDKILNPGGLISLGMSALKNSEAPFIPQYLFPIVISTLSRALMGKVTYSGVWPNFYMVKVGGTSTGKTDADKIMRRAICNDIDLEYFYGPDDFSSGPGLLRGLEGQPQCLINLDEISYLFKRFDKHDPVTAGKIEILLQLFTNCGLEYRKPYGDAKKSITLNQPCLSIVGNATTGIFDDVRPEDFTSGLIQRFTFWCYDGPIPGRTPYIGGQNVDMVNFLAKIRSLYKVPEKKEETLTDIICGAIELSADKNAYNRLLDFSKHIIESANKEEDQGRVGIISRKYYEAIKYALIFSGGSGYNLSRKAIDYGIDVAELLGDWKLNVLSGKVREGQFHRDCEIFKEGIVAAIKAGKKPTGRLIANRRPRIKELKPHEFKNVTTALSARKEIEIDDSGRSTAYFLLKN